MSVRSRLTLFFVAIVVAPLVVVSVLVHASFGRSQAQQARAALEGDQKVALRVLESRITQAAEAAELLAAEEDLHEALIGRDRDALESLARAGARDGLTVAVTGADGGVLAEQGPAPRFLSGVDVPPLEEVLEVPEGDRRNALFVRRFAAVDVRRPDCDPRCQLGRVWVGFWADGRELAGLPEAPDRRYTFVLGRRPVATSTPEFATSAPEGVGVRDAGAVPEPEDRVLTGDGFGALRVGDASEPALGVAWFGGLGIGEAALVVSNPTDTTSGALRRLAVLLALLVLFVLVVSVLLGGLLARMVSDPLRALAEGARRIARGEFDRVPPHTGATGEVGDLARAFDTMRTELDSSIGALRSSRDELTWAMTRIGDTLASTSDLPRLLAVVLEAAAQARQARAGSLLLFTPDRATLVPEATYRLDPDDLGPVASGEGIAGRVAATGEAIILPAAAEPAPAAGEPAPAGEESAPAAAEPTPAPATPARVPAEPPAATQVTVPLRARGKVLGVLSLYDRTTGAPFTRADATALAAFAGQAAVGIENVRLHEEARYLSMTDEMTGTWNYRYFRIRFEQEIERARRFHRAVSVLLLDVDFFKQANDRYGHQRGDRILRELAARVDRSIRDADTFARYGGEEFVLILPETDASGAVAAAEKLRVAIGSRPFAGADGADLITVTVSIGVACFPRHADASAPLLEAADVALYRAKEAGRNRVVLAEPSTQPAESGAHPGPPAVDPASRREGAAHEGP